MSKSPTFKLSVHIRDHHQVFLIEAHAFFTFQPLYLVLDSSSLDGWLNLCDDTDAVSVFKSTPDAPWAGESYNISNLGRAQRWSADTTVHRPHPGFQQGAR